MSNRDCVNRAIRFASEAKPHTSKSADKHKFWNEFFGVFGISRKTIASFEVPVLKPSVTVPIP